MPPEHIAADEDHIEGVKISQQYQRGCSRPQALIEKNRRKVNKTP
jgi:hypothetical protein